MSYQVRLLARAPDELGCVWRVRRLGWVPSVARFEPGDDTGEQPCGIPISNGSGVCRRNVGQVECGDDELDRFRLHEGEIEAQQAMADPGDVQQGRRLGGRGGGR